MTLQLIYKRLNNETSEVRKHFVKTGCQTQLHEGIKWMFYSCLKIENQLFST